MFIQKKEEKAMVKKLLFSIVLLFVPQFMQCWDAILVPAAYDKKTGWNVLIAQQAGKKDSPWGFFRGAGSKPARQAAIQAFNQQTQNYFHLNANALEKSWDKLGREDIVHFAKVVYKGGAGPLYVYVENNGGFGPTGKQNYAWLPIEEIKSGRSITKQTSRGSRTYNFLPEVAAILQSPTATGLYAPQTHQPQTPTQTGFQSSQGSTFNTWQNIPGAIYFYKPGEGFEFTNFYASRFSDNGGTRWWNTSEHYFQAQKFKEGDVTFNAILDSSDPSEAFTFGKSPMTRESGEDWEVAKVRVMLKAVRMKFMQNDELRKTLVDTGDQILVEDTAQSNRTDDFWGAGKQYQGKNMLGQILMRVRDELQGKKGIKPIHEFICYNNPSDYFAQRNGKVCAKGREFIPTQAPTHTTSTTWGQQPSAPDYPPVQDEPSVQSEPLFYAYQQVAQSPPKKSSELERLLYRLQDSLQNLRRLL